MIIIKYAVKDGKYNFPLCENFLAWPIFQIVYNHILRNNSVSLFLPINAFGNRFQLSDHNYTILGEILK